MQSFASNGLLGQLLRALVILAAFIPACATGSIFSGEFPPDNLLLPDCADGQFLGATADHSLVCVTLPEALVPSCADDEVLTSDGAALSCAKQGTCPVIPPVIVCDMDGTKNHDESGVDCGNKCTDTCGYGQTCTKPEDCATRQCPGSGLCGCRNGETVCNSACKDLTNDPQNCGACGTVCTGGQVCQDAKCAATCSAGSTLCNGVCAVTGSDVANCGACGNKCTSHQTCSGGVCNDPATASNIGCADGTRDAFTNQTTFPDIAGCAGAWNQQGIFPAPLRASTRVPVVAECATTGDDSATPSGVGCSAVDLCSLGWHICRGGEVAPKTTNQMCAGSTYGANEFFAASVSGTGCNVCATPANTNTSTTTCTSLSCASNCQQRNDLNNDFFGCGSMGVSTGGCEYNRSSNDQCAALTTGGWTCPNSVAESMIVTKTQPASGGGVLCCRD